MPDQAPVPGLMLRLHPGSQLKGRCQTGIALLPGDLGIVLVHAAPLKMLALGRVLEIDQGIRQGAFMEGFQPD